MSNSILYCTKTGTVVDVSEVVACTFDPPVWQVVLRSGALLSFPSECEFSIAEYLAQRDAKNRRPIPIRDAANVAQP